MELYIHLPFCARKCRYCDFASYSGREAEMSPYVDALLTEAAAQSKALHRPSIETVFIGGGTPSLLPAFLMKRLLDGLTECFAIRPDAEFTVEANPGTLREDWLTVLTAHGMNRLSMGMQAYQPRLLQMLGRIHDFDQVVQSVDMARWAGLTNISLDLMFGLPGQTIEDWRETLDAALSLSPMHLSCYGLIPEEGTPLKADLDAERLVLPDEDTERAMYDLAISRTKQIGMQQYEISNFALPDRACRHNLGYWHQVPYLGLGASASSCLPDPTGQAAWLRATNPPDIAGYMTMVNRGDATRQVDVISRKDACFETMMLGLRTTKGVAEKDFHAMHGLSLDSLYGVRLRRMADEGLVQHKDGRWFLTRRGMDVQNAILVELMDD